MSGKSGKIGQNGLNRKRLAVIAVIIAVITAGVVFAILWSKHTATTAVREKLSLPTDTDMSKDIPETNQQNSAPAVVENYIWNDNSATIDLSEIKWSLSQKFGINDLNQCHVYELFEQGAQYYPVLVQISNPETKEDEFVLFCYYYDDAYDSIIEINGACSEKVKGTSSGKTDDGKDIVELNFQCKFVTSAPYGDYGIFHVTYQPQVFFTYNDAGLLERVIISGEISYEEDIEPGITGGVYEFAFDEKGRVCCKVSMVGVSYYDFFFGDYSQGYQNFGDEQKHRIHIEDYCYDEKNRLCEIIDGEYRYKDWKLNLYSESCGTFEYDAGGRTASYLKYGLRKRYERDARGYIKNLTLEWDDYFQCFSFEFQPHGGISVLGSYVKTADSESWYTADGLETSEIEYMEDGGRICTDWNYDDNRNCTETLRRTYDAGNNITETVQTFYEYNIGKLVKESHKKNGILEYDIIYDGDNQYKTTYKEDGSVSQRFYKSGFSWVEFR